MVLFKGNQLLRDKLYRANVSLEKRCIKKLCKQYPDILASIAYTECNFTFADKSGLDSSIYQAESYDNICEMFNNEPALNTLDIKYKHNSIAKFKWHFDKDNNLVIDSTPITDTDIISQAIMDSDKILKIFFERAFNYPGSEVYCPSLLTTLNVINSNFWYHCIMIMQAIIDYRYE